MRKIMRKFWMVCRASVTCIFVFALCLAVSSQIDDVKSSAGQAKIKETLIGLEKQSWEAWKKRDGKFFQQFLSDDHVEIGFGGSTDKTSVVSGVSSPECVVKSYSTDTFQLTIFDQNT